MLRYVLIMCIALIGGDVYAHQFLPTYPKFQHSFIDGVMFTKMQLFNKRKEVEYYELNVYDDQWNKITFASETKLIRISYLQTKDVNVYVKKQDLLKVTYICTESKHQRENVQVAVIATQICSKVK
jgi:hypothetical protein